MVTNATKKSEEFKSKSAANNQEIKPRQRRSLEVKDENKQQENNLAE